MLAPAALVVPTTPDSRYINTQPRMLDVARCDLPSKPELFAHQSHLMPAVSNCTERRPTHPALCSLVRDTFLDSPLRCIKSTAPAGVFSCEQFTMNLPSPPLDGYDSDTTLRGPRTAPLTAPLTAKLFNQIPPPSPQNASHISPGIEILSPAFSDSNSGSEPRSPVAVAFQSPHPWYRRLLSSFWSYLSSLGSRFFPSLFPVPPAPQHSIATSHYSSRPPSPTSSTSSGFVSPSILKAAPAPPPILVPPPPSDIHLSEYFPLLSPRVGRLFQRRRTSSSAKSSPSLVSSMFSSPMARTTSSQVPVSGKGLLSPQASDWPPPLESPNTPYSPYSPGEEERDGEYVRIGHVISE